jgi:hypothetical protein
VILITSFISDSFYHKNMKKIKFKKILKANIFMVLTLMLTLFGCGGGGGGSSDIGVTGLGGSSPINLGADPSPSPSPSPDPDPDPGPTPSKSVTLTWDAPNADSDGSSLDDLAGYKIYYGTSSNDYSQSVDTGNSIGATISSLSVATWCFAVTAYDTSGNESDYSDEACI